MLAGAVPQVRAWELLHDAEYCGRLRATDLYELLLQAGYAEPEAAAAAREHGWRRLSAGIDM